MPARSIIVSHGQFTPAISIPCDPTPTMAIHAKLKPAMVIQRNDPAHISTTTAACGRAGIIFTKHMQEPMMWIWQFCNSSKHQFSYEMDCSNSLISNWNLHGQFRMCSDLLATRALGPSEVQLIERGSSFLFGKHFGLAAWH